MIASYRRAAHVLWRRTADRVLLLPVGDRDAEVTCLSGTGVVLWDLLAEQATVDELAAALGGAFGVDPDVVAVDIRPVLDDLVDRELLAAVGAP